MNQEQMLHIHTTNRHTNTLWAAVHLTLSLRSQVCAPADDLSVLASPAEQSAALQGAESKHAAFVSSSLTHDLKRLCRGRKVQIKTIEKRDFKNRNSVWLWASLCQQKLTFLLLFYLIYNDQYEQLWPLAPFPSVLMSAADFPHVRMFPSESPVRTSPVRLNTKHWINFGFLYFWREKKYLFLSGTDQLFDKIFSFSQ